MNRKHNRLISENSPYLLQHAYNPVDWYPWGDEAFERAKREDKPIFLSIGYSTCHWCHVMERESFNDDEVAEILNKIFICIKVDREERPDIDAFYMDICNIFNGHGGWPLNVFMTPDKEPFYVATYIPKETSGNNIGIKDLAKAIDYYWNNKRQDLLRSSKNVINIIKSFSYKKGDIFEKEIFKVNFDMLADDFDELYGGFGQSLKFPPYNNLFFLIKYYQMTNDKKAFFMIEKTLDAIRCGGIYDFISGGIHRYATDRFWKVPHFEKMLYDQALISILYSKAYLISKKKIYLETSKEVINYCFQCLKNDEGGFFCGEDADSEGSEGKFYLWEEEELKRIFTGDEYSEFSHIFNIYGNGNFREEISGKLKGKNVLYMGDNYKYRYLNDESFRESINKMLYKLKLIRDKRVRPNRDEKILFDWNCLIILAILYLFRITKDDCYKEQAFKSISFLEKNLIDHDFNIYHVYFKGKKKNYGFLEDYSYLVWCYLDFYQTFYDKIWLEKAELVMNKIIIRFYDEIGGGFFHTPDYIKEIPVRQKILVDSVLPSGNSVSLLNLSRLYKITDNKRYLDYTTKILETFSESIKATPLAYSFFINASSTYFNFPGKINVSIKHLSQAEKIITILRKLASLDWVVEFKEDENMDSEVIVDICSMDRCEESFKCIDSFLRRFDNI